MRHHSLDGDAFVTVGAALASTATVLVHGREALLIDALGSRADAAALAQHLARQGLSVRWIIATHYFSDHMAGLALFPGATVIAHSSAPATFAGEEHRSPEEAAFFVPPTVLIDGSQRLDWGRFSLEVFHNPGYTPDMLNLDIPELDAVHGGDTVVGSLVFLPYADPDQLAVAIDRLKDLGRSRLLLSHGGPSRPQALDDALHYLSRLQAGERELSACLAPGAVATPDEVAYHARNLAMPLDRIRGQR